MRMRVRILAARGARALRHSPPSFWKQRAQGKPGARCTRGLVCKRAQKHAHEHTGPAEASGFPCAVVLRLASRSPRCPGFFATFISRMSPPAKLDASIGAPGPHDFAVRAFRRSSPPSPRPPHPTARFVTLRNALLSGETGRIDISDLPDALSGILPVGLFCRSCRARIWLAGEARQ
jgi:hypothetical protein